MNTKSLLFSILLSITAPMGMSAQDAQSPAEILPASNVDTNIVAVPLATRNHVLQPLDKVAFYIEEDPAPVKQNERRTIDLAVSSQGQLEVPVSRCCEQVLVLNVKGKTVEQAEREIRDLLLADYYNRATIQLRLIDTTKRVGQVWLRGAVKGNTFQLNPGKTYMLWEVLTAVGLQEFANKANVQVDRVDPATGKNKTIKVDIEAVDKGNRELDLELQDGDRILVKEKWFNLL